MTKGCWLAVSLALLMALMLATLVHAARPPEDDPDQGSGRWVGLLSTEATCLSVQGGLPGTVSATVHLQWEGQIEEAYLVMAVAGSQGGHSIYVNGHRVASAPTRPGGLLCQPGTLDKILAPADTIPIPIGVLVNGENVITVTNDANVDDGWTAANLHLEIHGVLSGPPVTALEIAPRAESRLRLNAATPTSGTVLLTSTYELARGQTISQVVWYQVPGDYDGSIPVPLIIGVHGMSATGKGIRGFLAAEANNRGWLLAAPDMHGNYYVNTGEYALAWPGAQHDIIDTIEYMASGYNVDSSRIYIAGGSMGGQMAAMMAAKYPDVFAAAAPWKPITGLTDWYYELDALGDPFGDLVRIRREVAGTYDGATPSEAPFGYQRRSPIQMPQNSRPIPIKMWHDVDDVLVSVHHSRDLKNAINSWSPITPVVLIEISSDENECPPQLFEHCYDPSPVGLFNYLEGFALNAQPPLSLTIRTDESKPYYWLNLAQTGGDHWSEVNAAYGLADKTVMVTISDTQLLVLAFNLGSMPTKGPGGIDRPGMGLPSTTYLISGGGNYRLEDYTSGYLTTTLTTRGLFTLAISAIEVQVSADPAVVLGGQAIISTITISAEDQLNNPVPDGTTVELSTTEGIFSNGIPTYTVTTVGGQAATVLSLGPEADLAQIVASVKGVSGSTSVDAIHPAIGLLTIGTPATVYSGQVVTYTYQIINASDITLTAVTLADDQGTPEDSSDDLVVCAGITLATGQVARYSRNIVLTQTTTTTASVTGQDPLGNNVASSASTTVIVKRPKLYLPVVVAAFQPTSGGSLYGVYGSAR